jgi:hypothetical protein
LPLKLLKYKSATQEKQNSELKAGAMKKIILIILGLFVMVQVNAQCSICTKTASQLGEGPAQGLNAGIVYLMLTPFLLVGFIGYRWWRKEKQLNK